MWQTPWVQVLVSVQKCEMRWLLCMRRAKTRRVMAHIGIIVLALSKQPRGSHGPIAAAMLRAAAAAVRSSFIWMQNSSSCIHDRPRVIYILHVRRAAHTATPAAMATPLPRRYVSSSSFVNVWSAVRAHCTLHSFTKAFVCVTASMRLWKTPLLIDVIGTNGRRHGWSYTHV